MGVAEWPTRKMMFLKGDFDSVAVPRANMWDLLQTGQQYTPLAGIRLYYNMPALSNDAMFYCFTVDPTSPYVPKVGGTPTPNLFSNVHMRKAFNYALNFTTYLRDAWWSEAIQQASWWVDGLQPAAAKNTTLVPYTYDPAQMQAELQAAGVWDSGFEVTILYNLGNDQRKIAAEMIRDAFRALGTKYVVNVVGVDWPVILDYMEVFYMPVYYIGWLADFAYPDNFARPFMHSSGDFSYYQNYSDPHVDYLIDHAIIETNETKAIEMYQELQYIYWQDAVSLPIMQAVGRRWERDWVRGYYYNQLYPGLFFYDLWKAPAGTLQNVDVSVTHSITGVVYKYNVTQVWHAESRVGYRGPGQTPGTYQAWITNWTISASRDDTNGNVALLYVAVGLKTNDTYQDAGYLVLSPGGHDSINLKWYDDGVTLSISEGLYVVGGEASIITGSGGIYATDTNPANNYILWGNVESKALVGDINGDGIVDIYDALKLASAFGKKSTEKGYNADADLKYDKVIDIFDALKLAGNFGKFVSAVYP
jgi:peptide/nickel transport system substrate-binding protein